VARVAIVVIMEVNNKCSLFQLIDESHAFSLKARPHQQQCRSNIVEARECVPDHSVR